MVSSAPHSTLGDEARRRINAAVATAEKRTAAEILPVVAQASGTYEVSASLAALVAGLGAYVLGLLLADQVAGTYAFWVVFAIALGGRRHLTRLRRGFVGRSTMERTVAAEAALAQNDRRLIRSDRGTVLLFYVALFERLVVVAADAKVVEAVGERFLDELRQKLQDQLERGDLVDGLLRAIERAGERLADALPRRVADMDERPHELVCL